MVSFEIFRDRELAGKLVDRIKQSVNGPAVFMEVCGGHTMAIHRSGIPSLLPPEVRLISGPGCPVCVTGIEYVDQSVALSGVDGNIIVTYGDMIRVPGTTSTLEKQRSKGADIRVISSPLEALKIATDNPGRRVVFLAVGFETTTPATAITLEEAARSGVSNFFVHSAHKVMPPALRALADDRTLVDGLIAPGHVSTITGTGIYSFLPEEYSIGCVISGFEPVDILQTIYMLVRQVADRKPRVEIQYSRAVTPEGNSRARESIRRVFEPVDSVWRGLGNIPLSGLALNERYRRFDALENLEVPEYSSREPAGCRCGEVMKGIISPPGCPLFGTACTPVHPVGACMVSTEGSCHAWYRFNRREN